MNSSNKYFLTLLLVLWFIIHIVLFWHYGIRSLFDANGYVKGADFLIANGAFEATHHYFYSVPIILISIFRWLSPNEIIPYLIFQCILSGLAMLMLYRAGSILFNSNLAGLFSGIIFLLWFDNIHWNITTMTESLMCSLICFLIFALANFKGRLKEYFFAIGILILISFTRPTAVIIIFASLVFLFTYHRKIINSRPILKFTILAGLLVAGYFIANLLFGYWDFTDQYERGNIVTYMDTIEGELLYRKNLRIETSDVKLPSGFHSSVEKLIYFVVKNPMYFLKSSCLKVAYLISGVRPYYSLVHNIYSIVWLSLIYLLFYFGYINATNQAIKNFTLSVVIANCALIAISTVDWDNRFYVPMQPGIVLMAGGGASYLFAIYKTKIGTLFNR